MNCNHDIVELLGLMEKDDYTDSLKQTNQTYAWYNCVTCHTTLINPQEIYISYATNLYQRIDADKENKRLIWQQKNRKELEK